MSMGVKEEGWVTMPILENRHLMFTKGYVEATKKYEGTAPDHMLYNWTAGAPFPHPKDAWEVAWNIYPEIARASVHDDPLYDVRLLMW